MLLAISGRNKVESSDGALLDAWICNDKNLASSIRNSRSKEIATSIVYNGSVQEIYNMLSYD